MTDDATTTAAPPPAAVPTEKRLSIHALAKLTGSNRENISNWLIDAGFDVLNLSPKDKNELIRIIRSHQILPGGAKEARKPQRDKEGLTWGESKQKQETLKLQRENKIAEKALAEQWMEVAAHQTILTALTSKLESIPDKAKAELGLTHTQRERLQKMLDECRFDAAAETRRAFERAKKKVADEVAK